MSRYNHFSEEIRGVQMKKQWAVFAPDGYLQYRTISDTQKEAKERKKEERGVVFFLDERMVAFENGDKQELTEEQIELIKLGKLKPGQITKNH